MARNGKNAMAPNGKFVVVNGSQEEHSLDEGIDR
jgi:hypothetical protein